MESAKNKLSSPALYFAPPPNNNEKLIFAIFMLEVLMAIRKVPYFKQLNNRNRLLFSLIYSFLSGLVLSKLKIISNTKKMLDSCCIFIDKI